DVVDLEATGTGIAQQHVGHGILVEVAKHGRLPIQTDRAQEGGVGDVVVANVVNLEAAGTGIAQQHVSGVASVETAETRELPSGAVLAKRGGGQDCTVADVVDFVKTVSAVTHDHVRARAWRWRRGRHAKETVACTSGGKISDDLPTVIDAARKSA